MSEVYSALEQARLRREQQLGNATRDATVRLTYDTSGVGETTTSGPLDFGCAFVDPPHVTTGVVARSFPDITLWRYPVVSAGVWKWQTKATSDPASPLYTGAWLWLNVQCDPRITPRTDGAEKIYYEQKINEIEAEFEDRVHPTQKLHYQTLQSDYDQAVLTLNKSTPGTQTYEKNYRETADMLLNRAAYVRQAGGDGDELRSALQAANEAQLALRLQQNPPQVDLTHHITFAGIATQAYSLDARFLEDVSPVPIVF